MTTEDLRQELERQPFIPLRLHLSSGQRMDIASHGIAWVQQNTLLIVHPLAPGSAAIGKYDVIALRLIERIEQRNGHHRTRTSGKRRRGPTD